VAVIAVFVLRRFTEQVEPVGPDRSAAEVVDADAVVPQRFWNRNTVLLGVTAVVVGFAMYGFIGLYPSFLQKELHFSLSDAGLIASMFGLGAMMGLPAGYLMDRMNVRNVLIVAMLIGSGVGYLIFNGPTTIGWQFALSFSEGAIASGFCFVGVYTGLQRSVRPELVGRASGFYVSCFYIPASVAGYGFSLLVNSAGWGAAGFWQLAVLPLVGVVALLFVNTKQLASGSVAASH
jgi:MFS family permease